MKILHSADWHILLHKKKVPYKWQTNRFKTFFRKLIALEQQCDVHIISGDVLDKKPEPDEVCLFLSYINSVTIPTYIIPGNHEATKKGEILRGEGESEAVDVYANAFQKDPDFYSFYRSMQAYGNVLGEEGTTMILSPDSEFLEFFNNSKGSN